MAPLALAALVAGCSPGTSLNPIDWWHGLQDGPIADIRPPPPNADQPYPSLGSVPVAPTLPDAANRGRVMSGLVADRANAQYAASLAPIGTVPPAPARPKPATAGQTEEGSGATLQAASAPPRPAAPVTAMRPAPVAKVEQTALAAPAPASPAPQPQPLPEIPTAAPPPPSFAGVAATLPTAPPSRPPAPVAAPAPAAPGAPVQVAFAPGSAAVPDAARGELTRLAKTRGGANISVTGFGEASGIDSAAQSAALPLAWARARGVAAGLLAAGVPSGSILLAAQAGGRGGLARIAP